MNILLIVCILVSITTVATSSAETRGCTYYGEYFKAGATIFESTCFYFYCKENDLTGVRFKTTPKCADMNPIMN